ncbi:MAG: hypothetical protein K5648_07470 [Erysipelotrichaceae bacterium]|nr:hypothetical protein [Erysipelotrichaceae bacterium]
MNRNDAGLKMNLLMGATMSFVLSSIGLLSSGNFSLPAFARSFPISFALSFLLGSLIPMRKITDALLKKRDLSPNSLEARVLSALVSALVYSPVMTFVMVFLAYRQAVAHDTLIPFLPMLLRSELISLAASFVLSFLITPFYARLIFNDLQKHS